jgi:hypothetical protein
MVFLQLVIETVFKAIGQEALVISIHWAILYFEVGIARADNITLLLLSEISGDPYFLVC